MTTAWLIDGSPDRHLSPADRGLAYGDGLFETIAAPRGQPRRLDRHYARLHRSCKRLGIPAPTLESIEADIARLVTANDDCVIKIIVTRGAGGRGYRPPPDAIATRLTGVFPWPAYDPARYVDGIRAIHCTVRLGENPALAGMKHLCRLEQVLAQQEVAAADAVEGLLRSSSNHVISGTMSNVFVVSENRLLTPVLDRCGVDGIMRAVVIESARALGISVEERTLLTEDVDSADELFFCNSVFGIWPVTVLGDVAFEVGKLTQSLQAFPEIGLR